MKKSNCNYAEEIYNTAVILDCFCKQNNEVPEVANIYTLIKYIRQLSDKLIVSQINKNIK